MRSEHSSMDVGSTARFQGMQSMGSCESTAAAAAAAAQVAASVSEVCQGFLNWHSVPFAV